MSDTVERPAPVDSSAGHLYVRLDGRPEVQFDFARQPARSGLAFLATLTFEACILGLILYFGRVGLQKAGIIPVEPIDVVFIAVPGPPGGGGGGGGNQSPEPPKKAEIPKEKTPEVSPVITPEPTVTPQFNIPTVTTLAQMEMPGAVSAPAGLPSLSQGSGRGGGGGTGVGTGIGPGTGSGIGPGSGGGMGGGVYKQGGNGVTDPTILVETKPKYTGEAMRAHMEGEVWVECTVTKAGNCTNIRVTKSLDTKYGLDQEAMNTVAQWRFKPGTYQGQPVEVLVGIAVEFRLR